MEMIRSKIDSYASVWDAITDTPEGTTNLRLRSELMKKTTALIQKNGWTQLEAAKHCNVTQPRINELLRGRISRFSLDALINIAAHLSQRVHVELETA